MRNVINFLLVGFFILLCSFSCTNSEADKQATIKAEAATIKKSDPLTPNEMIRWVENKDNGLFQEKTIEDITFSALFKPIHYMTVIEYRNVLNPTPEQLKKAEETYAGMTYFTYKMSTDKTQDELLKYKLSSSDEYYHRLEYYSFKAQNDFSLVSGNDTIACKLFHFERTFGLAPVLTFVLGFKGEPKTDRDFTLIYKDRIFNKGLIKLNYSPEILNSIPKIKLNKQ